MHHSSHIGVLGELLFPQSRQPRAPGSQTVSTPTSVDALKYPNSLIDEFDTRSRSAPVFITIAPIQSQSLNRLRRVPHSCLLVTSHLHPSRYTRNALPCALQFHSLVGVTPCSVALSALDPVHTGEFAHPVIRQLVHRSTNV